MVDQTQQPHPEDTRNTEPLKAKSVSEQHSPRNKKPKAQKVGLYGNLEFECIEPSDLKSVPVLVQALDN